eukprot:TRINITY_DN10050_c0_g1_i1.p1 TRINITY_DN10050_c0_g1~~TRINITY_DN10050_c0_g1_i1.p1  ORF type:complete len:493 (-),score=73.35 TRINITY_DN10050_c0_g1_i1:108-1586(-)
MAPLLILLVCFLCWGEAIQFQINTTGSHRKWDHFWEECVGSGHAALALRADYQAQLRKTHEDLGFKQIRFHGLFVDDMSVVLQNDQGSGIEFSFFNVDRIFDFLLSIGMRPLVEIGFMPKMLASGNQTWSHYDANVTPPKNWSDWTLLIESFANHLIDRYGLEEVLTWNFEVWNEPNCCPHDFWTGSQADYFYLFNVTSRAMKSVHPRLRVGGPATAMSSWIPEFLQFCHDNDVPYDFVSTHEYPTDPPGPASRDFFVSHLNTTRMTVPAHIPVYYTEYDDGYNDGTSYSAAFAIYENYNAHGVVQALSWWPFTDIFEEGGLYPDPYALKSGWLPVDGLMNVYGIPKPNYRAFQLLHWTGDTLLTDVKPDTWKDNNKTVSVFATTGNGTSIFVVNWNPHPLPCVSEKVSVFISDVPANSVKARVYVIDSKETQSRSAWEAMGSPLYLKPHQVNQLDRASELVPQDMPIKFRDGGAYFSLVIDAYAVWNIVLY